jgi:cysteine-rich repeat protein
MGEPVCGDGALGVGEQCDDGNTVAGDGCDELCRHENCGNGVVDPLEQCDDGNTIDGDGCDHDCTVSVEPIGGVIKSLEIALRFDKPAKDKIGLKLRNWALPEGLVPGEFLVDVGGARLTGTFDAKGRYKSVDKLDKAEIKQSRKSGLWQLTVKRKKGRFSPSLADDGLTNRDEPKPGALVTVPLVVTLDGVPYGEDAILSYRAKAGKKGNAK